MSSYPVLHLRQEQRPYEHRAFSPDVVGKLVAAGYPVHVERSSTDPSYERIFKDQEYSDAGAKLVDTHTWTDADKGTLILGLKELPEEDFPLKNDHIQFSHCYKDQGGWEKVLGRFPRGGSTLYDLEFLVDEQGRRVSAFGYHAGFAGAALALKVWAWQLTHPASEPLPSVENFTSGRGYYLNEEELVQQIREDVAAGEKVAGRKPHAMILGALGRCGRGAADMFKRAGLTDENLTKWDLNETKDKQGPYKEIVDSDIFLNAIYLSDPIPPFVNQETLSSPDRKLTVVCDVSCDTSNPHNPIPIYNTLTTFTKPTLPVKVPSSELPLSVIAIDHLPSMMPREASDAFSQGLLESLLTLKDRDSAPVWKRAEDLFKKHVSRLPPGLQKKEV
ncbi:Formate/glycerate dehydrogenase catalytic domain-like protein [Pseudovirgaria hyperparasitica]|uniref:Saccharopine dehydrogenase [NAD(+), L-lysine-forming] n=1 Tax=Pseudovirgaria hyperparasitica TaxID=470096 RepID=A0A6A6WIN9_9PEZI|nr:Formate/glycerate dehydrogenase catalytic domain-like protein [Pseudovirgaria hyperparasitica]KAF2761940.1 Formate/glycerate dehydrogenase catalytic domain-like protein [Pseudovirgaria hyperparasitica]